MTVRLFNRLSVFRHFLKAAPLLVLSSIVTAVAAFSIYWNLWVNHHFRAAKESITRRDFEGALAHLSLCLKVWPRDAETHFLAARTARRAGRYDDAERYLSACQRLQWVPEAIALERALLKAQRDDPSGVDGYLLDCVRKDHPDTVLILEALSRGYMRNYQMLSARYCLEQWLSRQPDDVQALLWHGEVSEREHPDEALCDYGRILELAPERDGSRLRLAELLLETNRPAEAIRHYEQLSQRQPGNPAVVIGLARCRYMLGQTEEARKLLDSLLTVWPNDPQALCERGQVALQLGQCAEAEHWLRKAIAVAPFERKVVYSFYQCLNQRGKQAEAAEWLARLERINADLKRLADLTLQISRSPDDPDLRYEAGMIMLRNGQQTEGLRWLESALRQNPRHAATRRVLADNASRSQ